MTHFGLSIIPIIGGIYWWNIRVHVNTASDIVIVTENCSTLGSLLCDGRTITLCHV